MLGDTTLKYVTWGSCNQHAIVTILLPSSERLERLCLLKATPKHKGEKTEVTVEVAGYKVRMKAENRDSNKNINRLARVTGIEPTPQFIVVLYERKSCKKLGRFYKVYDPRTGTWQDADIQEEVTEKTETREDEWAIVKVRRTVRNTYIVWNQRRYLLETSWYDELLEKKPKKLRIVIDTTEGISVLGDTYYVREALRRLGLKWNPLYKVWVPRRHVEVEPERVARAVEEEARRLGLEAYIRIRRPPNPKELRVA